MGHTIMGRFGLLMMTLLVFHPIMAIDVTKPAHIVSPDHYELLMENEQVLVLKMTLKPGEADVMHRHGNETVYFEKGGKLTIRTSSGDIIEANVPDGHVMWHAAWTHQVTNVGNTEVIAIIVEEKSQP